jgi:hypothetical protein
LYARAGQREEAQKILARLTDEAKSRHVSAYGFALMYLALGNKERAIDELERLYRERAGVFLFKVDAMLDDLRGNPRFEALVQKVFAPKRLRRIRRNLRHEPTELLCGIKAPQCLQGCHRLLGDCRLLMQIATQVFPFLEIPNWAIRLVIMLLALGFPIALIIAWTFELTPEGLKRTEVADRESAKPSRDKAWIYVVVVAAALSVGLFFVGRYTSPKRTMTSGLPEKSIAVLPFENLSEDRANAYFAEGIQEEILTRLAKIADLKVISRTSTQRYESKPGNLAEIAKQLGVANILEASVQKAVRCESMFS